MVGDDSLLRINTAHLLRCTVSGLQIKHRPVFFLALEDCEDFSFGKITKMLKDHKDTVVVSDVILVIFLHLKNLDILNISVIL